MIDAQRTGSGGLAKLGEGVRANSDARTQAGLGRGPNQSKKLINAAWTDTFPAQGATLDLDFANDRGFVRGLGQGRSMDAVTFTRASNGNYVKADGTLSSHANQGALGNNLLTFPQDFDNAAWSKTNNAAVTANTDIAPNETLTADTLINGTGGSRIHQTQSVSSSSNYVLSVYAKKSVDNWFILSLGDGNVIATANSGRAWFDLDTGSIGTSGTNGSGWAFVSASILDVGDGWYRCSIVVTTGGTSATSIIAATNADNVSPGAGSVCKIWGAQLELGSTATEYSPTNIGQPRFDWASTAVVAQKNLLSYTENLDNAAWTKFRCTISANIETAPDGTLTADATVQTAGQTTAGIVSINATVEPLTTYTISVYAKAKEKGFIALANGLTSNGGSNTYGYFNLTSGVIGTMPANVSSAVIESVGSGWYRCSFVAVSGAGTSAPFLAGGTNNDNSLTVTDNGGIYIWGAQIEKGNTVSAYQPIAQPTSTTTLAANPTCNGLLIEEARTNRILWCRDATQVNWVSTNITAAKDQTGIDGVANAASSLTATANDGTCIQTITLASGSRTGSVYLKRITGTGNVQVSLDGTTWSTVDLSASEWRRIVLSGTVTNPTVGIKLATSGDAVAMDYGQVEDGAFVTSPILTTVATATRSADVGTLFAAKFGNNVSGYNKATFCGFFQPLNEFVGAGLSMRDSIGNGNINNMAIAYVGNGNFQFQIANGTLTQNNFNMGNRSKLLFKAAISFCGNRCNGYATDGNLVASSNFSFAGGAQPIINSFVMSPDNTGSNRNMYIKRAIFYPSYMETESLKEIAK